MTNIEVKKERNNYSLSRDLRAAQEIIRFSYDTTIKAEVREEIQSILWHSYYTKDIDDFVEVNAMIADFNKRFPSYLCSYELCVLAERLFFDRHTI